MEYPEASRRPPPTEEPELDEALADLHTPDPRVAESAAPVKPAPAMNMVPQFLRAGSTNINAAAHAAYDAINGFRQEVIEDRIKSCIKWLQLHMGDALPGSNYTVEVFGSKCYHLELCSSDVDVVVILGPGQSSKTWLEQLRQRTDASPDFNHSRKGQRWDCLQTSYLGVPVDIKPIRNSRASYGACRSSDSLKFMIEQRMFIVGKFVKLRAILIFKLLCHHLHVVQHHWKARAANSRL